MKLTQFFSARKARRAESSRSKQGKKRGKILPRRRTFFFEPLEPRLLLAADPQILVTPIPEIEPNNALLAAITLSLTEDPASSGLFLGLGLGEQSPATAGTNWSDPDYWRFEALAGDIISVRVDTPDSGVNPYVELRSAGGRKDSKNSTFSLDLSETLQWLSSSYLPGFVSQTSTSNFEHKEEHS